MMTDRLISGGYQLRGAAFELWSDGHSNPGMYPNWYLATDDAAVAARFKVPLRTVLIGEEFDPPLTENEMREIGETVLGYFDHD
jgi:hypothetical protein